jgi:hypothetical protein
MGVKINFSECAESNQRANQVNNTVSFSTELYRFLKQHVNKNLSIERDNVCLCNRNIIYKKEHNLIKRSIIL